jgi:hypothetical protein
MNKGDSIMAVHYHEEHDGKVVYLQVTGRLSHNDYQNFVPQVERLIERFGSLRILFEMNDFHGWEAAALWDDLKFDTKHFAHIDRLAIVGDKKWEKGMAAFCKPFTTAEIKYFDHAEADSAHQWIEAGMETPV